jgi:hypothetical protein
MATAHVTLARPAQRRRSGLSERRLAAAMLSSLIVILAVAAYSIARDLALTAPVQRDPSRTFPLGGPR